MAEPFDRRPETGPGPPLYGEPYYVPATYRTPDRVWLHVLLLALTVITTTLAGALHYASFANGFGGGAIDIGALLRTPSFYLNGLWYSGSILAILGCHEMGHYVACLRYRVDASLPFFLPLPPDLFLTGTLGAFIRIRQRIPSKIALFDIGIAGPIAGFVVAVPVLLVGVGLSHIERLPEDFVGYELGEPLLFRAVAWLIWGDVPDGSSLNLHPMAFAAWFGLLATALNLFPISQLDGGHISYAVLGRRSTYVSLATIVLAVVLAFGSMSWIVWTVLMIVMLAVMGPHHPPTLDDHTPLDRGRVALAVVALLMLIVCFTPAPIEIFVPQ